MTHTVKHCAYTHCGAPLKEDQARFEVRVASECEARGDTACGVFCDHLCWQAATALKSVEGIAKHLLCDAETVLSEEGKIA